MAKSNFEKMRLRYQHLSAPDSEPSIAEFNRELKNDLLIPKLTDYHASTSNFWQIKHNFH